MSSPRRAELTRAALPTLGHLAATQTVQSLFPGGHNTLLEAHVTLLDNLFTNTIPPKNRSGERLYPRSKFAREIELRLLCKDVPVNIAQDGLQSTDAGRIEEW